MNVFEWAGHGVSRDVKGVRLGVWLLAVDVSGSPRCFRNTIEHHPRCISMAFWRLLFGGDGPRPGSTASSE